jgi:tRNA(fMet)-specific endonuclease VapC
MAGTYLLDTNAAIALMARDAALRSKFSHPDETYISVVALGELYFGAEQSARVTSNREQVDMIASEMAVIECNIATARQYGKIRQQLRSKGRPIPDNDIWIAALAIQHNLTLLTRDAHFAEVAGLTIEGW